jgi:hypothetical protein
MTITVCFQPMPWGHGQEPNGKSKGKGRGKQRDEDGQSFHEDISVMISEVGKTSSTLW